MTSLRLAIQRGVEELEKAQQPDGSFLSYSSSELLNFSKTEAYRTTFLTSLILSSLVGVPGTATISQRAAAFLLTQFSPEGTVGYWARGSAEAAKLPYPDDLDDTFCALAALWEYDPDLVGADGVGRAVQLLTRQEVKEGGPYRTWVVTAEAPSPWQGVDLAVNANIAYFLRLQGVNLPSLQQLMEKAITSERFNSPYYPSALPVLFFLSRAYRGGQERLLVEAIRRQEGRSALEVALIGLALRNLNCQAKERALLDLSWEAAAFCLDPTREGVSHYAGSAALTTAFCLAALSRSALPQPLLLNQAKSAPAADRLYRLVIKKVASRLEELPTELRKKAQGAISSTLNNDPKRERTLLPYYFAQAIQKEIPTDRLVGLGTVTLYGWTAYTLYDDFLDEGGEAAFLPVANIFLRELTLVAEEYIPAPKLVREILDGMEAANLWEVHHTQIEETAPPLKGLPEYGELGVLAERSLGHALGPLGVLLAAGYISDSAEIEGVRQFFRHYLIARQLNDDAHDWVSDLLQVKRANAVGARVLATYQGEQGSLVQIMPKLQRHCWELVMSGVCDDILAHLDAAQAAVERTGLQVDPGFIQGICQPLREAAGLARKKREELLAFAKHFRIPAEK